MAGEASVDDINVLSAFLANPQVSSLSTRPVDTIVICVSAVFYPAEQLFRTLERNPSLTKTLVLCGGVGHSTPLIYDAVAKHELYRSISEKIKGLPESRVLSLILETFFDVAQIKSGGCRILVEDQSTNCGANAVESRKVLENAGIFSPKSLVLIQDPTMSIRTKAAFDQVYSDIDHPPEIVCWPGFVPKVKYTGTGLEFDVSGIKNDAMWEMERFLSLIMGEIPRLELYGPSGKGSIAHVEVPGHVREAWSRLNDVLVSRR